jgi:hypothetical protein
MKYLFILMFIAASVTVWAQPPQVPAVKGATFGAPTDAKNAVEVSKLPTLLANKENVDVKVKGKVIDVCPKKGCWMALEMPDNSKVFVKMKDYGFFVPLEMIGKDVVIDGQAKTITTSVDELRHYAEDAKKSQQEIDAITEPKKEIRLTANGILVL